jgi:hypothetical protein
LNSFWTRLRIRATSDFAWSTVAPGARRAIMSVIRCVRPCTIIALVWCSLMTMFISASIRSGKYGAGCTTPTIVTGFPSTRIFRPITVLSPWKRFCQNSWVSTITGGTEVPSSSAVSSLPSTPESPITWK